MNKPTFKELYYLCIQKLTNFPYIEKDFDALTNYELLCKVVEELNKMIQNMNTQNESIIALYNAFNKIKDYVDNYFENLDVQEEINNKLDKMSEDGTLQEIISEYLNSKAIFGFDNVASMKEATNLINGSFAKTMGYYTANDGGASLYKISSSIPENEYYEILNNGLYAILIIKNIANIAQYGVSPLNPDNTSKLNSAFLYNTTLEGFNGIINVSGALLIEHNKINYDFKGLTINVASENTIEELLTINSNSSDRIYGSFNNLTIENNGMVEESLCIYDTRRVIFENLTINGSTKSEIAVKGGKKSSASNVVLKDIRCTNGRRSGFTQCNNCIALNLYPHVHDSYIENFSSIEYPIHIHNEGFNWFHMIHCWNALYVKDSLLFDIEGTSFYDYIYSDTIETLMKITGLNAQVMMSNVRVYYNPNAELENVTPKPFIVDSDFVSTGRLKISSSSFTNYGSGGNDLITFPENTNFIRLNGINISNSYTGNYKVEPFYFEYYFENLSLDFTGYDTIPYSSNTIIMARVTNIKGLSLFNIKFYTSSINYTVGSYMKICKINTKLIAPLNSMTGHIITANNALIPLIWRINNDNEIEIRISQELPSLTSFSIYLDDYSPYNQLYNN